MRNWSDLGWNSISFFSWFLMKNQYFWGSVRVLKNWCISASPFSWFWWFWGPPGGTFWEPGASFGCLWGSYGCSLVPLGASRGRPGDTPGCHWAPPGGISDSLWALTGSTAPPGNTERAQILARRNPTTSKWTAIAPDAESWASVDHRASIFWKHVL